MFEGQILKRKKKERNLTKKKCSCKLLYKLISGFIEMTFFTYMHKLCSFLFFLYICLIIFNISLYNAFNLNTIEKHLETVPCIAITSRDILGIGIFGGV